MRRIEFLSLCGLIFAAGCSKPPPAPVPPPPPQPKQNLFVLFPEVDETGSINVSNAGGSQDLAQPYAAVRVETNASAPVAFTMEKEEAARVFGPVLAALPAAEAHFTLPYEPSSSQLTAQSRALLPKILEAIRERRSTYITVTGHTDTTASADSNYRLGLERAESLAEVLRSLGVDRQHLFVASHGESDPLVKTADGVAEPRNRRVEVIVR